MKFKAGAIGWLISWSADNLNLWPWPLSPAAEHDQEASVLHPPTALYYSRFTLTLLTYHEKQWEINSRLLNGKKRFEGRDESPVALSCYMHVCMFCASLFIGIVGAWLLPATRTPFAAVLISVIGNRCCDVFIHSQWCKAPQPTLWSYCVLGFGSRGASQSPYKNPEHFLCVTQCVCYSASLGNACEHLA